MTVPFYVPPEQLMKDRAEYARKGIARGRPIVAMEYADGVLMIGENTSGALYKISEIYDRIAFGGTGKHNEFEGLRVAGIRLADLKGYSYGRSDVTAKSLANAYSQTLGSIFTTEVKPYEVEILVAEVGPDQADTSIFRITYDGSLSDERGFAVIGGESGALQDPLQQGYRPGMSPAEAISFGAGVIEEPEERPIDAENWEVAVLDRSLGRRTFRRVSADEVAAARA